MGSLLKSARIFGLCALVLLLVSACAQSGGDDTQNPRGAGDDDAWNDCTSCTTTSECTAALGEGFACRDSCCADLGSADDADDDGGSPDDAADDAADDFADDDFADDDFADDDSADDDSADDDADDDASTTTEPSTTTTTTPVTTTTAPTATSTTTTVPTTTTSTTTTTQAYVRRVVIAGDSWAAGFVPATIAALADRGYTETVVSWETTALPGTTAEQWASNEAGILTALGIALDANPPAEILLLSISGNDLLGLIEGGFGDWFAFQQNAAINNVVDDTMAIVNFAKAGRPNLTVVQMGYDYLEYDFIDFVYGMGDMDTAEFNGWFVELGSRELAKALATDRYKYAHNFGLMQYHYGDVPHLPFLLPPVPYAPGSVPFPGSAATGYFPFPGGLSVLPGPLDQLPDGIHPTADGFRVLVENVLDQGLDNLMNHEPWN